jgi:4'-phosphopantetheinyl transferase
VERELIEVIELSLAGDSASERRASAARALSAELARRLGRPAGTVVIERSPSGKPRLGGEHPALRFSLAHCRERGLIAISADREVGVDLEAIDPRRPHERLAERWFTAVEHRQVLAPRSPEERISAFYRLWVAKEACVKATGEGLAALGSFSVDQRGAVRWSAPRLGTALWKVRPLSLGEGWAAAVAAPGCDWQLVLHRRRDPPG